jgi:hypothetical protein
MAVVEQQPEPKQSAFPINRVVAFAGPYIAILSGAVADWLVVHVHLLSLFHTTGTQVAGAITQISVFGLTSILVWLGQHKWLSGWQKWAYEAAAGEPFNGPEPLLDELPAGSYDPETAGEGSVPVDEPITPQDPNEPLPGEPAAPTPGQFAEPTEVAAPPSSAQPTRRRQAPPQQPQ